MSLFTGQIPLQPLRIQVRSGGAPVNLTPYASVSLVMWSPLGVPINLSAGQILLDQAAAGIVKFAWPTTASLFPTPGDYRFQLRLSGPGVLDITSTAEVAVSRAMEAA